MCALVALIALAGNAGAATRTGGTGTDPWIASELPDYAPGSTVNLLGGSWQPGEAVHVNVNDNDGQTWSRDVDVTADPSGDISDSFALPNWFVAQYTVTATGASGTATTTFTDGNLTVRLATADQASPAPSAISFSYTTFNQDTSCSTSGSSQTAGPQAAPFNVGIGGGNNSARAVSAAASGYTFAYFSNSATSTTPLTGSQLCFSNSGDVYAHFTLATRSTTTSLASNNNPSTFGQGVTFTATVTASAGNPGANGSVTFKDGASTITGCSSVALNASSQATCTTSALDAAASPHGITAVYSGATSGGTTWNGSTSSALSQTVTKAGSTTTVTCTAGPFVYNGSAKTPCSATVTGAGGLNQAATVSYSDNVNAGTATASASYAGDANHNSSSDSKNFTIGQAGSTTTVTCPAGPYVYNGSAQSPCSAVATGAGGLNQSLSVDYSNNTHAGTASASAAYAGDANHTGSNDSQTFTIDKRDVTASITAAGKTYDGSDDAEITGCSLEAQSGDHGVISGDSVGCTGSNGHFEDANAGSGKAVSADVALSGTAKGDYHLTSGAASTTADIDRADSTTTVTCGAGPYVYDGTAQTPCSAHVSGAGGLDEALNVDYSNNTHAGTATASAVYGGDANHTGSDDSQTFTIDKRDVTASISAAGKTYDGSDTAEITGCSLESATGDHGVVSPDAVGCTGSNGHFVDKHAGADKSVAADVALTGDDKADYRLTSGSATTTATIQQRQVTASITAAGKTYDGSDSAAITGCSLESSSGNHGVISGDAVGCAASNGHFADEHAGADKSVGADVALTGDDKADYKLGSGSASTTATIDKRDVTASITAAGKTYDGNDSATIDSCSLEAQAGDHGVVSPDAVGCAGSNGHFANKHAGAGKSVSADVALTGDDKADYRLTSGSAATTADIDAADLEITAVADSKVYDGTTSSAGVPTVSGLQGTDTVTGKTQAFASKNVLGANGSTLDVAGYTVNDGNSGGDYHVHAHAATGTISTAALHISAVGDSKTYDGNTGSTGTPTVAGLQTGDTVTGKTQAFQSKDVLGPNGSTLVVTGYTVNDGNSGGNYAVTTHTAAGTITKKGLTVSGITASDKVFDGNSTASLNLGGAALVGVISPDAVALSTGAAAGTFANPGVGTWTVTISGLTLSGGASGNYSLTQPTTTASILPWNAAGRGFYAPVGADAAHSLFTAAPGITPTVKPSTMDWNSAKGGSTVPLKFNVFAGTVEKTTADAFPGANLATAFGAAKLNVCTDTSSEDPVDFTTSGSTSLRYDGTAGQWIQNWKTPNVTGDSCYRAWVTLADGSTLEAFFKLKK
jgi:hypothetical protein